VKLVWSDAAGTRNNSSDAWDKLIRLGLTESTDKKPTTRQHQWRTWASFTSRLTSTHSSSFVRSIRMQPLYPYRITRPRALRTQKSTKTEQSIEHTTSLFVYISSTQRVSAHAKRIIYSCAPHLISQLAVACLKNCSAFLHAQCAETCCCIWIYCAPPAHTDVTLHFARFYTALCMANAGRCKMSEYFMSLHWEAINITKVWWHPCEYLSWKLREFLCKY
jgi:hypothetical protein